MTPSLAPPAIALAGIDKRFGAVHANKAIDLTIARASVHGIVGENGAGKSTLMSILYGFYEPDGGEIRVDGVALRLRSPLDAIRAGIGMVHQHFMLVEPMSVIENIALGIEGGPLLAGGLAALREKLTSLSRDFDLGVDLDRPVEELGVGDRQRVEILKALVRDSAILILDEPTAVLTPAEADHLFGLIRTLKEHGKTVVLITHKLREIMAITDHVSVMRRGEMLTTLETAKTTPAELARLMVGREVITTIERAASQPGDTVLRAEHLILRDKARVVRLDDVSLSLQAGEIVGVAGIAGNGQSELLEALSGMQPPSEGRILLGEADIAGLNPAEMRARGLLHVPEDRQRAGLVMSFPEYESSLLGYQYERRFGSGPLLDPERLRQDARDKIAGYDIRPADPEQITANFSGGNQQKIVLAREIERTPRVLLVGQPTRGVDIGAIEFIHRRLLALREAGAAVLLVSVELDEILALSDRVLVMFAGKIVGELPAAEATREKLGLLMAGVTEKAA